MVIQFQKRLLFSSGWSLTWDQWEKKLIPEKNLAQNLEKKPLELRKQIAHLTRQNFLSLLSLPKFSGLLFQPPAILSNKIFLVTEANPKGLSHGHAYYH